MPKYFGVLFTREKFFDKLKIRRKARFPRESQKNEAKQMLET